MEFCTFTKPIRCIFNERDLESFRKSSTSTEIFEFVKCCAGAVVGRKISDEITVSSCVQKTVHFLSKLNDLVDEIPPIQQPMRFGNKAFRDWYLRLDGIVTEFLTDVIPESMVSAGALDELSPYLMGAFGVMMFCFL